MCTVSYVFSKGKIIITSNRDEQTLRPAWAPKMYSLSGKNICFPKDPRAGGTWYAADEQANIVVLLNGADEQHLWQPPYRKSRGLIVLDIICSQEMIDFWTQLDLDQIEPFTIVLYFKSELYQLRWDGHQKTTQMLPAQQSHIWSSSTLYTAPVRARRREWFAAFLQQNPNPDPEEILRFHQFTQSDDMQHGLVINRDDVLKTLSITQTVIDTNKWQMHHLDLMSQKEFDHSFIKF